MQHKPLTGLLCLVVSLVSCKERNYSDSETRNAQATKGSTSETAQVNPMAYNAFIIWRDGKGTPVLNYPTGITTRNGAAEVNESFQIYANEYWTEQFVFLGSPTTEAHVSNNILTYPVRHGQQLNLRFKGLSDKKMSQEAAVKFCQEKGLRLPSARELLDYCTADTEKAANGSYPKHRCTHEKIWSASVNSRLHDSAWYFDGSAGNINITYGGSQTQLNTVQCVGR